MLPYLKTMTRIYNINFMGKKPQKCRKNCAKHHFILKPVDYFAYISRSIEVSFCPPSVRHYAIFPTFNKDRKYYTSSFMLKEDELKYASNDAIYKKEHQNFCNEQLNGKSQMLQPKPRTKTPYCHICKDHYEDYSDHILSQAHKKCISANKFSAFICDLVKERYSECQPIEESCFGNHQNEESFCNDKEIVSNTTILSNLDEQPINQGFTFVSGQGVFELHNGLKMSKLSGDSVFKDNRWPISPHFQILLRRSSTTTSCLSSDKKSLSLSMTKFPIIVTPID